MKSSCNIYIYQSKKPTIGNFYTGYFTSDNALGGIENATHNTSGGKAGYLSPPSMSGLRSNVRVLWVAFSIPPGSLSLVKYPVF
jgi:hypothetical protein